MLGWGLAGGEGHGDRAGQAGPWEGSTQPAGSSSQPGSKAQKVTDG